MPALDTLPDYIRPGLALLSIGLNPSLPSVRAGFYFANPRNRFWTTLCRSRLVGAPLRPGADAIETLYRRYDIGFTDVVKRPTAGAATLRAADFKTWAPRLRATIVEHAPAIAWFHGKMAYREYLRHAHKRRDPVDWGLQPVCIDKTVIFVSPNPSPANAAYSPADLLRAYDTLAVLRDAMQLAPAIARGL